ncbi:MAG: carbamoyltransferase HypF, partial [Thermodesulfovibrionales bacterium]|nr:carbamoyltransferase HypF [Thermodesulfovibrionales bacterium]
ARIEDMDIMILPPAGITDFQILESEDRGGFTPLSPDIAICDDCLRELFDPSDRRYLYPFINCTNCGPRYTITKAVPYDRPNTTMNVFKMCSDCEEEYHNPLDRRFHAQPNACPECGPQITLLFQDKRFQKNEAIERTVEILKDGGIVAIKGIGGFHLACDAEKDNTVRRLRERKRRSNKPFALMSPDIEHIRFFAHIAKEDERLLLSKERPIVLLKKRYPEALSPAIAPLNGYLGFMLPYSPLHYLLFYYPQGQDNKPNFKALVMTSGNISEEPIVIDNEESLKRLSGIADAFLFYNRDIFMRVDDSVVFTLESDRTYSCKFFFIRRSRGYAPGIINLPDRGPEVLATGADLKNSFVLTKENHAILSQHIGDMENYETLKFFEETLENLRSVYRINPVSIACDRHPEYLSTRWAESQGLKVYKFQHHHAHIASVMAEHGLRKPVIGVAMDGTGYGTDGTIWGSEFLIVKTSEFMRMGRFKPVALPGGERAIKETWRIALSILNEITGSRVWDYVELAGFDKRYGRDKVENILKILTDRTISPLSSGAGRFFDAIAALTGICDKNTFEAEAPIALESIIDESITEDYAIDMVFKDDLIEIDISSIIPAFMEDIKEGVNPSVISTKFHNTFINSIVRAVAKISMLTGIRDVCLSGGVFQNRYILKNVILRLTEGGLEVYTNRALPPNDASIALGQAYILREMLKG